MTKVKALIKYEATNHALFKALAIPGPRYGDPPATTPFFVIGSLY